MVEREVAVGAFRGEVRPCFHRFFQLVCFYFVARPRDPAQCCAFNPPPRDSPSEVTNYFDRNDRVRLVALAVREFGALAGGRWSGLPNRSVQFVRRLWRGADEER